VSAEPIPVDRRQRRRLETIEEVLDVAAVVMAEQGVAGLSIGEVARRMGIRPPSLYVYFESKNALYDALFARGARLVLDAIESARATVETAETLEECLLVSGGAMVRWAVAHPAYSQLLFWRPVPGYEPSPEAYAPAVQLIERSHQFFTDLQHRGLLRDDVPVAEILRDWTIVTAGITSQQLSNAPHETFDNGTFTAALPGIVTMFARYYAPVAQSKPTRRAHRADKR
jgi:AcrR family transcriptional regulator